MQEVPPLLNGDSSNRSQQQQHQQRAVQPSQSESPSQHSPGPQSFRSLTAVSSSSPLHTPHSNGGSTTASTSPSSSGGPILSQHAPLHISTSGSSSLQSPLTSMSTALSLSPGPPSSHNSPMQGLTLTSAPHSPPLPHSAPLSRAMTPVPSGHQGSGTSLLISNPQMMKATEVYATSTLPLPRRPIGEARTGGVCNCKGRSSLSACNHILPYVKQEFLPKMFFCSYCTLLMIFFPIHDFSPGSTLPRVLPLSPPARAEALFAHAPSAAMGGGVGGGGGGGGSCLLPFLPGDTLILLISEPRDGWHYGQNERTGRYRSTVLIYKFDF